MLTALPLAAGVQDWTLPDWISVVGLPLSLAGIAVAIWQLVRTQRAAEAAKDAVQQTQKRLAENHLLLVIPRLMQATRDVEHAVSRPDRDAARVHLAEWRDMAVQVRALVTRKGGERSAVLEKIDLAIALIAPAEEAMRDDQADPHSSTRHVRERMRDAIDEANAIMTERMAFVDTSEVEA